MALPDFPNNPSLGERYYSGKNVYEWDGSKWKSIGSLTKEDVVTTSDLLTSKSFKEGDVVTTIGFYTKGDGGGGQWRATNTTGLTPSQTPSDRDAAELVDGSGRLWTLVFSDGVISILALGHVYQENTGFNSPATDSTSIIQAAHDHLSVNGGGEVVLGGGVIGFSETLYFGEGDPVLVRGSGRGVVANGKPIYKGTAGTRMVWTGSASGDGIVFTSDRNNNGDKNMTEGGGLVDVMLDGNETGGKGLSVISHCGQVLRVQLCYWTDVMFYTNCLTNGNTNGPSDNQRFVWNIHTGDVNTSNEPNSHVVIHGTGGANTSLGIIEELRVQPESSAVGVDFCDIDGTFIGGLWSGTRVAPTGDGGKVIYHSTESQPAYAGAQAGNARHTTVKACQCTQGIVAKGGVGASVDNYILSLSRGNGAPIPSVESGASIFWATDEGVAALSGLQSVSFGANDNQVKTAKAAMAGESVRFFSGSNNHAVWMGAGSAGDWSQNVNSANGDLRLNRVSGNGSLEIDRKVKFINQETAGSNPGAPTNAYKVMIDGVEYWVPLIPA